MTDALALKKEERQGPNYPHPPRFRPPDVKERTKWWWYYQMKNAEEGKYHHFLAAAFQVGIGWVGSAVCAEHTCAHKPSFSPLPTHPHGTAMLTEPRRLPHGQPAAGAVRMLLQAQPAKALHAGRGPQRGPPARVWPAGVLAPQHPGLSSFCFGFLPRKSRSGEGKGREGSGWGKDEKDGKDGKGGGWRSHNHSSYRALIYHILANVSRVPSIILSVAWLSSETTPRKPIELIN